MQIAVSTLAWIGFCIFILIMLAIDLGVFNRKPHEAVQRCGYLECGVVSLDFNFCRLLSAHSAGNYLVMTGM